MKFYQAQGNLLSGIALLVVINILHQSMTALLEKEIAPTVKNEKLIPNVHHLKLNFPHWH